MSTWINGNFPPDKGNAFQQVDPRGVKENLRIMREISEEAHYTESDVEDIKRGLDAITRIQHRSAMALPERSRVFPSPQIELVTAAYALQHEVGELVDEFPWKPWRQDAVVDAEKAGDEYSDVLHFLAWLTRVMQQFNELLTTEMLARAFVTKAKENDRRFAGLVPGREPPAGTP
jgi:hypothetical protein